MELVIREENENDYSSVEDLVKKAFEIDRDAKAGEHELVRKLRRPGNLSLVAMVDGRLVGHIMLSRQFIKDGKGDYPCLALAPLAVLPSYQGRGIGSQLVEEALSRARNMDYGSVFVLGHEGYYPKFGFIRASSFSVKAPFEVPDKNFMALELKEDGLKGVSGTLIYGQEFYD
ncbi:MAG: N-acetyltransferase [Tissierellia bacterium]|nr:N-acetyltransferase [Tissierellia bacterium]